MKFVGLKMPEELLERVDKAARGNRSAWIKQAIEQALPAAADSISEPSAPSDAEDGDGRSSSSPPAAEVVGETPTPPPEPRDSGGPLSQEQMDAIIHEMSRLRKRYRSHDPRVLRQMAKENLGLVPASKEQSPQSKAPAVAPPIGSPKGRDKGSHEERLQRARAAQAHGEKME